MPPGKSRYPENLTAATQSLRRAKIVLAANSTWNIVNFRKSLIEALGDHGYSVVILSPPDDALPRLQALHVKHVPLEMNRKGTSPIEDLYLLFQYWRILKRIRPAAFLGFTAKPNIYGSLAAALLKIVSINNISGLGTAFIRRTYLTVVVTTLYKIALRASHTVFFQNTDDRQLFLSLGATCLKQSRLLPGSGVDLEHFNYSPPTHRNGENLIFLLVGRLLWDKGVGEFVGAAQIVRELYPACRFRILGFLDSENRTAVPSCELVRWQSEHLIEYLGGTDDVRPAVCASDVVVLPSYREGLPRALLEAGALGRPLIATDVPGCRDVVQDGTNGYLCAPRNAAALAASMIRMIELSTDQRVQMGAAARESVQAQFSEEVVIQQYLQVLKDALNGPPLSR